MTNVTKTNQKELKELKEAAKKNPKLAAFLKEQKKREQEEAKRIASLTGLPKMIHEMQTTELADAVTRRKEIKAQLEKAEAEEKEIRKEIQHMQEVEKMSRWSTNNSMKWYKDDKDVYLRDEAWKYFWKLRTAVIDFYITVSERTDMKKFKYAVSVHGTVSSFNGDPYSFSSGIYRDHDAIKKVAHTWKQLPNSTNYGYVPDADALDREKKFTKLEDAEKFAKQWMDLIEKHYKDELKKDRDLLKLAKKTK